MIILHTRLAMLSQASFCGVQKGNTKRTAWKKFPCAKLWTVEVLLNPTKLEMLSGYLHGRWVCHSRIVCCLNRIEDELEFLDSPRISRMPDFTLPFSKLLGNYRKSGNTFTLASDSWIWKASCAKVFQFSTIASLSVGLKTETIPRPTVTALSERPSLSRFVSLVHCTSTFQTIPLCSKWHWAPLKSSNKGNLTIAWQSMC